MYRRYGLFIGGVSGTTAPVFSPVASVAAAEAPFGGTNHSGMGREGGTEGIRDGLDVNSSQMVWA